MRILEITLSAQECTNLPIAYNHLIQGALYSFWKDALPNLHDVGYSSDGNSYRLFTFSPLKGKCKVRNKEIAFSGPISIEVRSPNEDLMECLAANLANQGKMRLGRQMLDLVNLRSLDRLIFPGSAIIEAVSPITVHEGTPDGKTRYPTPWDDEYYDMVYLNLERKMASLGINPQCEAVLSPIEDTLKKRVTTFKGIYVTGWTGKFIFEADPLTMHLAYHVGLGDRNSQGFGMFNILDGAKL